MNDKDLTDQAIREEINRLEHSVHEWGSMSDARARLERLRAIQSNRVNLEPAQRPRPIRAQVRQQAIVQAGVAVDEAYRRLQDAVFLLIQGHVDRGELPDILGLLDQTRARLSDMGAPIIANHGVRPRDGQDAYGRTVRYLSQLQHELLTAGCADGGTLVAKESGAVTLLERAGLLETAEGSEPAPEGYLRWTTTPAGRRAIEAWHYQVEAG